MRFSRAHLVPLLRSVPLARASWHLYLRVSYSINVLWRHKLDKWVYRVPSEVVKSNTKKAFDYFYSQNEFVETDYLRDSRLAFIDLIADYCAPELADYSSTSDGYLLIDVGCGTGHFLLALQKRLGNAAGTLIGMDFSSVALSRARALIPGASFIEADIYSIPYPTSHFDVVTSIETLEHLKKPQLALSELSRICKPNGRLVITVPDDTDDWDGHVNFWTTESLRSFLAPAGVVEIIELPEHGTLLARVTINPSVRSGIG